MNDHATLKTRREFLRTSALGAGLSWTLPLFLERTFSTLHTMAAGALVQTPTGRDAPILVVLQLAGGNDGLNAVVPYADDMYYQARPTLAIPKGEVLPLDAYSGFNKRLAPFKALYDDGLLAIVQGVGYPNPNRSHFRSTEIWQTAVDADRTAATGWLGRYFDNCCSGADPSVGVSIGAEAPQAFSAADPTGVSFSNPESYHYKGERMTGAGELFAGLNAPDGDDGADMSGATIGSVGAARPGGNPLDFLQRTALDARVSSDRIRQIASEQKIAGEFPRSRLGDSLRVVAQLIAGGLETRVYYVSQGGYDTHNQQAASHPRLLEELGGAVEAFMNEIKSQGNLDRVTLMTFSEFGRRVAENGSKGTDHGAAAPLFIAGAAVRPGLYGRHPSLTALDKGDLVHTVDFRRVYATILKDWLGAPPAAVLGREFPTLDFILPA